MNWKPIETAPGETWVVVWHNGHVMEGYRWGQEWCRFGSDNYTIFPTHWTEIVEPL